MKEHDEISNQQQTSFKNTSPRIFTQSLNYLHALAHITRATHAQRHVFRYVIKVMSNHLTHVTHLPRQQIFLKFSNWSPNFSKIFILVRHFCVITYLPLIFLVLHFGLIFVKIIVLPLIFLNSNFDLG